MGICQAFFSASRLEFRHHDKFNQLGDLLPPGRPGEGQHADKTGSYQDWTGYTAVNPAASVPIRFPFTKPLNPDHWQPLTFTDASGSLVLQMFSAAHWGQVTPFALTKGEEFRDQLAPLPARYGSPEYEAQARELIGLSANLTDRQKMIAEFWTETSGSADGLQENPGQKQMPGAQSGPGTTRSEFFCDLERNEAGAGLSESPLEHWFRFAEFVSKRDHHSLDDDVKMYFALSNAMFDASIAAYDAKRAFDSVRPITAIAFLFHGQEMRAWGGAGKGPLEMDGSEWHPYQPAPTPPSPEYVSGISAESAAAAEILLLWTGSDQFGYSVTLPEGSSRIEPGTTPAEPVTLRWRTFTEAADEAGMAGRYAGIHFAAGDLAGRKLGRLVAAKVWAKAQAYFDGTAAQPAAEKIPSR
jgi:hypothetical protein